MQYAQPLRRRARIFSERTGEKVVVDQAMVDELLGETGDDEDLIRYDL